MQRVEKNRGMETAGVRNQKSAECCGRASNLKEVTKDGASQGRSLGCSYLPEDFVYPFPWKSLTVWFEKFYC